ncbi:hypothetical protein Taro_011499 [Colocasia esculenta]|uniref:Uncharacterized protein n=1 Tax=Colocasia esculenta TaxID=4460 RepID=A0A843UAC1_COLES|nr:hypothetical protein [Colocasia esculenta]
MERIAHEVGICLTCSHGAAVGPFVRDCETERLFLCCVVRVGYWPDQPVVRSRVVASFFPARALPALVAACVTRQLRWTSALATLMERIAHEVGMYYVVSL